MYAVFVRLTLSPCLSKRSRHISSSLSTAALDVSHRTSSSANSMAQGGSVSISEESTSIMIMKSRGLIADPWCSPTFTLKYSVFPSLVVTWVWQSSYISWMILMYASGNLLFRRLHHISSLGTRSYAFSRSMKTMWSYLFISLYFSCSILNANIGSVIDLPGLNTNWLSAILVISLSLASIILSHNFIV